MSQFETIGGGYIEGQNRRTIRKVYVSTEGPVTIPPSIEDFPLSDLSVTREAGGIVRATAEYTQAFSTQGGSATYDTTGKRVELIGGTREVPIYNHPKFSKMTVDEIKAVQEAAEQGPNAVLTAFTPDQEILYGFLARKIEYFLSPAIVGRVSEIESNLPSLAPIAKVADPNELDALPDTFWICTSISATPVGNKFEVTREYTLTFAGWEDVETLYNWDEESLLDEE
jgi:hypothetical protein